MKKIDKFLDAKTMYQLVWQSLMILALFAVAFGFFGIIAYGGLSLVGSLIVLTFVCYGSNYILGRFFSASVNFESAFITALILFFILSPATDMGSYGLLTLAGIIAMASKYLFAIHKKHIFNPAAISVFILGLFGVSSVIWWVATPSLLPFVVVFGYLILKKTYKFKMFFTFAIAAIVTILGFALSQGDISNVFSQVFPAVFLSWPLFFFGTIMLTEPQTTPPQDKEQTIYGVIVGFLFGVQFHIGPLFSTPEFALVAGNVYSYIVSPKYFLKLILREKKQITPTIHELSFTSREKLQNIPGQYMEWTLPHKKMDSRGTRRYFTVASSPTEQDVKLGTKISLENGSSFKKNLLALNVGDTITASGLAGDFVLPQDKNKKLVFIAGGIGITPYRSMIQYLIDKQDARNITLLYGTNTKEEITFKEVFDKAEQTLGLKIVYIVANGETNMMGSPRNIDAELITDQVPDYKERTFYISGPPNMVENFVGLLESMGVRKGDIITDFFPGFA